MALVGGAFLVGDEAVDALESIGELWPVGLIILGLYALFRYGRRQAQAD